MKDKDLLKLLKQNGWEVKRISGSHHIMEKDGKIKPFLFMGKMFLPAY